MKNKILSLVIITVLSAILLVTSLFTVVSDMEQIKSAKDSLKSINFLVSQAGNDIKDKISEYDNIQIDESGTAITYSLVATITQASWEVKTVTGGWAQN